MADTRKWVGVWGNSMSVTDPRPEGYAKNITLRYKIHMPFDGSALSLGLSNETGTEDAIVTRATILLNGTVYPVECNGRREIALPVGKKVYVSAEMPVHAGDEPIVCLYFGDFTSMRASVGFSGPLSGSNMYFHGDQTETFTPDAKLGAAIGRSWYLSDVSVLTDASNRAVVCYGDSITTQAWPDFAQLRAEEQGFNHTSFVRRAIGGSRVLRAYDCVQYANYGRASLERFLPDIEVDGADTVVILQGVNDIIHPVGADINPFRPMSDLPTADELIDGLKTLIAQARNKGLKVYVGTITPFFGWSTYKPFREELRQAVNAFIRTTDLIDGCVDFDAAVRDKTMPNGCAAGMMTADNLHPADPGHKAMAYALPEEIFR